MKMKAIFSSKYWIIVSGLHGVISQNMELFRLKGL
jgi:hypothetical protein